MCLFELWFHRAYACLCTEEQYCESGLSESRAILDTGASLFKVVLHCIDRLISLESDGAVQFFVVCGPGAEAGAHPHRVWISFQSRSGRSQTVKGAFVLASLYVSKTAQMSQRANVRQRARAQKQHNTTKCRQKKNESVVGAGVPAPLHEKRVIACARNRSCTLSSASETSLMEHCHTGNFVDIVSKSLHEMVEVAQKLETAVQLVSGLGFPLTCMKDADHDALWRALLNEVLQRRAHAPNCSVIECDGTVGGFINLKYTARLRQRREWAVLNRDVVDGRGHI